MFELEREGEYSGAAVVGEVSFVACALAEALRYVFAQRWTWYQRCLCLIRSLCFIDRSILLNECLPCLIMDLMSVRSIGKR